MRRLFFIIITILSCLIVTAATVSELEKQKKQAQKKLELTSSLISKTAKSKTKSITQLNLLNAEIKEQNTIIRTINSELNVINKQLRNLRYEAKKLQIELDTLKSEYAKLMYHTYFNTNEHRDLMFILSAKNFGESLRRMRYIKQYANSCQNKAKEITLKKEELNEKLEQVEKKRVQRSEILSERKAENSKLNTQKRKQTTLVNSLKKKESSLRSELRKQQRIADKINREIEKAIEAAAKAKAKKTGKKSDGYALTKEEKLIAGGFEKNKGRLPWPVLKGIVTGKFGIQKHAVLKYVTTNNKGIYIQSPKGTEARSVFEGEVTQAFSIPGSNTIIIIKHGNYRTVYGNLSKAYVKVGDKVKAKEEIGKVYTDSDDGDKTELYFQVWKDKTIQNPELWLSK